jgi:catechol 2,3-dioxygenase-like lactoylglutathione lyase family enzyme
VSAARLPRWTHIALRVLDIEASIAFYTQYTPLELLDRREDDHGYGAWLGHRDSPDAPFILVLAQFLEGHDPFGEPRSVLGPFAHLGIELASRADVDAAAATAEVGGFLQSPPVDLPPPIGYVCMVRDPDGNTIEFSHDQGVLAFAQEHMR